MMTGMPDTDTTFWQTPLAELTRQLGADINGLTSVEAAARLQRYGANRLESQRRFSLLRKVLSRFRNPLVLILLAAATVSAFTGDIASLVIISAMVLFSVLLDSVQEYRAEQAADQLKISVALKEQALRDGREITVRRRSTRSRRRCRACRRRPGAGRRQGHRGPGFLRQRRSVDRRVLSG